MEDHNGETHVETDFARGGSTPNIVRWVLGISLLAAIVLLSIVWITGAATHDDTAPTASERLLTDDGQNNTDGLVGEQADELEATSPTDSEYPNRVEN